MVDVPNQPAVGVGLIVIGTLLFIPGAGLATGNLILASLTAGSVLLTVGTYLFGTSESGRAV
jgi:hypothetical protein